MSPTDILKDAWVANLLKFSRFIEQAAPLQQKQQQQQQHQQQRLSKESSSCSSSHADEASKSRKESSSSVADVKITDICPWEDESVPGLGPRVQPFSFSIRFHRSPTIFPCRLQAAGIQPESFSGA